MGKSQTFPYRQSDSQVNTARPRFETGRDRMFKVNKLFITWLFALVLRAHNWPVDIMGE